MKRNWVVDKLRVTPAAYLMVTHGNGASRETTQYHCVVEGKAKKVAATMAEPMLFGPMPILNGRGDGLFDGCDQTWELTDERV